jgi:hypothetical protein
MSTDLLSMDYEDARAWWWFSAQAPRSNRPCGWPMKEKPGGLPSRARVTHRKHNGMQGSTSLSGGRGLIENCHCPTDV